MPFHKRQRSTPASLSDFDDAPSPAAKPARRVVLACLECRNRRCKCDGALPTCSNCLKHGRPACEYKAVTPEENLQARRRKNYPELTRPSAIAGASKGKGSAAARRAKAPRRARDEVDEEEEEDAEGEDDEEYTPTTLKSEEKAVKRRRVSSSSSSVQLASASATHSPIPLLPLPPTLPPSLDTRSHVYHEQQHQSLYFSCPPASSRSIALPPFTAGVAASPYPTPFSPPTATTIHELSQHSSHPSYFPFHYPSAPQQQQQQQFILFQPPPSSPPAAYHQPLPYSQPNYSQAPAGYILHQPLPTPYWPAADNGVGYPFPPSSSTTSAPTPSTYSYIPTTAPLTTTQGLGFELPYPTNPIYDPQPHHIYPSALPYSVPPPSFAPHPPLSTPSAFAIALSHPSDSPAPAQLPTPSSDPSSPTLAAAPSLGGAFDLGLGLEEEELAPVTELALKMEKQWSHQQQQQLHGRLSTPFEQRFVVGVGEGQGEWSC